MSENAAETSSVLERLEDACNKLLYDDYDDDGDEDEG